MGMSVGFIGLGQFARHFTPLFLHHPQVDRVALCDLEVERVREYFDSLGGEQAKLSEKDCFDSMDEILKTDLDAVVVITQQWLHSKHALQVLEAGKSVWSAVPVLQVAELDEILDDCQKLIDTVTRTGKHYFLGETSMYRPEAMFCQRKARAGAFGSFVYAQGEYSHSFDTPGCDLRDVMKKRLSGKAGQDRLKQFKAEPAGKSGKGPMLYATHSLSGPLTIMNTRAVKVSCFGQKPITDDPFFQQTGEQFSNETALFQLANGATLRISEHRETAGEGDRFSVTGTDAAYTVHKRWRDFRDSSRSFKPTNAEMQDPLPDEVLDSFFALANKERDPEDRDIAAVFGAHGGAHPFMVHEFVTSVLDDRMPAVSIWDAAKYEAAGVTAHRSALMDGECLEVPDFGEAPRIGLKDAE
jgi:predicted dehydrogenase